MCISNHVSSWAQGFSTCWWATFIIIFTDMISWRRILPQLVSTLIKTRSWNQILHRYLNAIRFTIHYMACLPVKILIFEWKIWNCIKTVLSKPEANSPHKLARLRSFVKYDLICFIGCILLLIYLLLKYDWLIEIVKFIRNKSDFNQIDTKTQYLWLKHSTGF